MKSDQEYFSALDRTFSELGLTTDERDIAVRTAREAATAIQLMVGYERFDAVAKGFTATFIHTLNADAEPAELRR